MKPNKKTRQRKPSTPTTERELRRVETAAIKSPEIQMRSDQHDEAFEALVNSIRLHGIIQPLVLRNDQKHFRVIAGHRRLMAAQRLHLKQVPAIIVPEKGLSAELLKVDENLQRANVNPFDLALYFKELIATFRLTKSKLASILNKSEAFVTQHLDILEYDKPLREALQENKLAPTAARELHAITNLQLRASYTAAAIANGVTPDLAAQWRRDANMIAGASTDKTQSKKDAIRHGDPEMVHLPCSFCQDPHAVNTSKIYRVCQKCDKTVQKVMRA